MSHSQGWKRSTQTRGRGAGDSSQQVLVSEVSEGGQVCVRACACAHPPCCVCDPHSCRAHGSRTHSSACCAFFAVVIFIFTSPELRKPKTSTLPPWKSVRVRGNKRAQSESVHVEAVNPKESGSRRLQRVCIGSRTRVKRKMKKKSRSQERLFARVDSDSRPLLFVWHESVQLSDWSAACSQSEAAAPDPPAPICGTCETGRKKPGKHFEKCVPS